MRFRYKDIISIKRSVVQEILLAHRIIDVKKGCWILNNNKPKPDGYTRIMIQNIRAPVHQWAAYAFLNFNEEHNVLHKCDNPPCWNPDHLYMGTLSNNTQDMWDRKRRDISGINNPRSVVTEEIATKARALRKSGYNPQIIANILGISRPTAWRIITGRSYL